MVSLCAGHQPNPFDVRVTSASVDQESIAVGNDVMISSANA